MTWPFLPLKFLQKLISMERNCFQSRRHVYFFHFENWKQRAGTAVSDVFVQWGVGRIHADVWIKERTVSHLLYRLLGMSSISSRFIYGQTELSEKSEIVNWSFQAVNYMEDWRVLIGERTIGSKRSPQAILKLLGSTLPLMTGLQGLLGLSGFVMNSTTWLGLLFPSELYAATWRMCMGTVSEESYYSFQNIGYCLHR